MNHEELLERLCDDYCRWPKECADQEELELKCEHCRMIPALGRLQKRTEKRMIRRLLPSLKLMALILFIRAEIDLHLSFSWPLSFITALLAGVFGLLDYLSFKEE